MAIPVTYVVMLAVEQVRPARQFPRIDWWKAIGGGFVVMLMAINVVLPLLLADWTEHHRLFDGTRLGVAGGAVAGFLLFTLVDYAWHRWMHNANVLWRGIHQLHHSPVRVDISGSAYASPAEIAASTVQSLIVSILILGLDPLAAAIAGYAGAFYAMFQHWNIRTPQWLGYLIQRPESHCLHHEFGVHARNYGLLPLWDLLFGTFSNPPSFEGRVGFEDPASRRMWAMLRGVDVNEAR